MTCLLRNLYAGQGATVRTGHVTAEWFQIGKGVHLGCILSPCLFNLYADKWGNYGNSEKLKFFGSKITAYGDCSHEIKRRLLLGRKIMTKLDSILKSRDITFSIKVHLVKAMVF